MTLRRVFPDLSGRRFRSSFLLFEPRCLIEPIAGSPEMPEVFGERRRGIETHDECAALQRRAGANKGLKSVGLPITATSSLSNTSRSVILSDAQRPRSLAAGSGSDAGAHAGGSRVQRFVRLVRLLVSLVRGALSMTRPCAPRKQPHTRCLLPPTGFVSSNGLSPSAHRAAHTSEPTQPLQPADHEDFSHVFIAVC